MTNAKAISGNGIDKTFHQKQQLCVFVCFPHAAAFESILVAVEILPIARRWSERAMHHALIQRYKELKAPPIKKIFLISSYNHTDKSR